MTASGVLVLDGRKVASPGSACIERARHGTCVRTHRLPEYSAVAPDERIGARVVREVRLVLDVSDVRGVVVRCKKCDGEALYSLRRNGPVQTMCYYCRARLFPEGGNDS